MEKTNVSTHDNDQIDFVYHCSKINPTFSNFFILNNQYSRYVCVGCFENCYKGQGLVNSLVKTEAVCDCLLDSHVVQDKKVIGRELCELDIRLFCIKENDKFLYYCSHCLISKPELFASDFELDESPDQKCLCSNDIGLNIHMKMLYKSGKADQICIPRAIFEMLSNAHDIYNATFSYSQEELDINRGDNLNYWVEFLKTIYTFGPHFDIIFKQLNKEIKLSSYIGMDSYSTAIQVCESKLKRNEYIFALFHLINVVVFERHFEVKLDFDYIVHLPPSFRMKLLERFREKVARGHSTELRAGFDLTLISLFDQLLHKNNSYISRTLYLFVLCMTDKMVLDIIETRCTELMLLFHTETLTTFENNMKEIYQLLYLRFLDILYKPDKCGLDEQKIVELKILITSGSVSFTEKKDRDFGFSVLLVNNDYHRKVIELREKDMQVGEMVSLEDPRLESSAKKQNSLKKMFNDFLKNKIITSDFLSKAIECLMELVTVLELDKFTDNETEEFVDFETKKMIFFKEIKYNAIFNSLSNKFKIRLGLLNGFCRDLLNIVRFFRCDKVNYHRDHNRVEELKDNLLAIICHILESISEDCYEVALYVHQELIKIKRDFDFEANLHILMYKQIIILSKKNDVFSKNIKHYSLGDKYDYNDLDGPLALYFKDEEHKITTFIRNSLTRLQELFESAAISDSSPFLKQIFDFVVTKHPDLKGLLSENDIPTEAVKQDIFDGLFEINKYSEVVDNDIACLLVLSIFFDFKLEYDKKYRLLDRSLNYLKDDDKFKIDEEIIKKLAAEPRIDNTFKLNMVEFFFRYNEEAFETTCSFNIIAKTMNFACIRANSFQLVNIESIERRGKSFFTEGRLNLGSARGLSAVADIQQTEELEEEASASSEEEEDKGYKFKVKVNNIFEFNHAFTFDIYSDVMEEMLKDQEHRAEFLCDTFVQYARTIRVFIVYIIPVNRDAAKVQIRNTIKDYFMYYEDFLERMLKSESCKFSSIDDDVYLNDFLDFATEGQLISFNRMNIPGLTRLFTEIVEVNKRIGTLGILDTIEYLILYKKYSDFRDGWQTKRAEYRPCMPIQFRTTDFLYNKNDVYEELVQQIFTELNSDDITYIKVEKVLIELNELMENEGKETTAELFKEIKGSMPFMITKIYVLVLDYLKYIENDFYNEQQDVVHSLIINLFIFIKHLNDNNNQEIKQFFADMNIEYEVELGIFDNKNVNSGVTKVGVFVLFSAIIESISSYLLTDDSFLVSERNKLKLSEIVSTALSCISEILEGATAESIDKFFDVSSLVSIFHESEKAKNRSFLRLFSEIEVKGIYSVKMQRSFLTFFNNLAAELRIKEDKLSFIYHSINPEMALKLLSEKYDNLLKKYVGATTNKNSYELLLKHYKLDFEGNIYDEEDFQVAFLCFNYISILATKNVKRAQSLLENKFLKQEIKKGDGDNSILKYSAINFFKKIFKSVEIFIDNELKTVFFPIEPKLFLLLKTTKKRFLEEVNRENSISKKLSLVEYSNYFKNETEIIAELIEWVGLFRFILDVNFAYLMGFLFVLTIGVNLLLLSSLKAGGSADFEREGLIYAMLYTQIGFSLVGLILWFAIKFKIFYLKMRAKYCYARNKTPEMLKWVEHVWLVLVGTLLKNDHFLTLFLMFCLGIVAIVSENSVWVVSVQLLLAAVLSKNLNNIIIAVYLRKMQLFLALVFIMILIFIYTLLTFYYLASDFVIEEPKEEFQLCTTAAHCFFSMIEFGMRMGGGVGDSFNIINWQGKNYWTRFTLSFTFYFFVVLIMLNIISGIIIDTFSDLREKAAAEQFDRENICLVCGDNKAEIVKKEGKFDKHIEHKHNVFNYMLYIISLKGKNKLELNEIEGYVLAQMSKGEIDWMPDAEEKEENEEAEVITDEIKKVEQKVTELQETVQHILTGGVKKTSSGGIVPRMSGIGSKKYEGYFDENKDENKEENKEEDKDEDDEERVVSQAEKQQKFLENIKKHGNFVYVYMEGKYNDLEQTKKSIFEKFIDMCFISFRQIYNSSVLNSYSAAHIMNFRDKSFLGGDNELTTAVQRYMVLVEILNTIGRKVMRDVYC